jgi:hypothetical protein
VCCRDATASFLVAKVRGEFSHIFTQSPCNVTEVYGIACLACQDEFYVSNPLAVKGNDEHSLGFAVHLSRLFRSALNRGCHLITRVRLLLSSPNASLILGRFSVPLFPRFAQSLILFLCLIHHEIISNQIYDSK